MNSAPKRPKASSVARFGRAHRGGDADCRSAADDHFAYGLGDLAVVGVGVGDFLARKPALVEHDHAAFGPFDGLRYVHSPSDLANFIVTNA